MRMTTAEQVALELTEMKKLGMHVPLDPAALTDAQKQTAEEFRENGMKISEIADYLIQEASVKG